MTLVDQITLDLERQGWSFQQGLFHQSVVRTIQPLFDNEFVPAKVGKGENQKRDESIRGDTTFWIDPIAPEASLLPLMNVLKDLQSAANRKLFLGAKEFECHLAKYPIGSFYKKHIDRHASESNRVLSFVIYLNESWGPSDGGDLVLYNKQNEVVQEFLPLPGSMVCFLSDEFPHEVKVSRKERRSLTGWMHTKIIY